MGSRVGVLKFKPVKVYVYFLLPFANCRLPKTMKASLKSRYDTDKSTAGAAATVAFNAGDVKLRASMTDATVVNGPSLNGLALAVEKPGFFIIDYNVPKKVPLVRARNYFYSPRVVSIFLFF